MNRPIHRRHVFTRILAVAAMSGAASLFLGASAQAKPISRFIGKPAIQAFCAARGGTYSSNAAGYGCEYKDRDGKVHFVVCPPSGYGCEFVYAPPNRPKSGAAAVTVSIGKNAKLEPQRELQLTDQLIAEQARSATAGKAR